MSSTPLSAHSCAQACVPDTITPTRQESTGPSRLAAAPPMAPVRSAPTRAPIATARTSPVTASCVTMTWSPTGVGMVS